METSNDVVVSARVKSRPLATVARFFHSKGMTRPSKGMVIRVALEEYEKILIRNQLATPITDVVEAHRTLEGLGMGNLNPGRRGMQNYVREQQRDVYRYEGWDERELDPRSTMDDLAELERIAENPRSAISALEDAIARQTERSKQAHETLGDAAGVAPVDEE